MIRWLMVFISSSLSPLVVTAGVPIRIPLVTNGLAGSFGTAVFIDSNIYIVQSILKFFSCNVHILQIYKHQMIVCSVAHKMKSLFHQCSGQCFCSFLPPVPDMSETPALMPPRSRQPSLRSHASEDLPVFPGKLLYQSVLHTPFYRGSYRHAVLAMFYASSSIPHLRRVPDSDEVLPQQALRYVPYPRKG